MKKMKMFLSVATLILLAGRLNGEECYNDYYKKSESCMFGCCDYDYYNGVTCCQETGAILGIVFGVLVLLGILIVVIWCKIKQVSKRERKVANKNSPTVKVFATQQSAESRQDNCPDQDAKLPNHKSNNRQIKPEALKPVFYDARGNDHLLSNGPSQLYHGYQVAYSNSMQPGHAPSTSYDDFEMYGGQHPVTNDSQYYEDIEDSPRSDISSFRSDSHSTSSVEAIT